MLILGILGGVACGKSLVARQFAELGAGLLDADRAGHEVLRMPEVEQAARARWGDGIFGADGHVDRAALAKIVFAPGAEARRELTYLEQLTHPGIATCLRQQAGQFAAQHIRAVVLDAPLLLRAGWNVLCDQIIFIDAPWEVRVARAATRGWNEAEVRRREAAQEPLEEKRRRADGVIDNSGSPEHTRAQVVVLWKSLLE
ncbi:MAG TPA: dephospho-CoA kinase [Pirellulales bacterium]|jgi:dephospho-CoA kinase|nr:dephospho-CoA kinase [Pirellulales bacterium]